MSISLFSAACVAVLFFWLAWQQRVLAFAVLLVLLPTYQLRFTLLGVPGTLLEVLVLVLVICVLVQDRAEIAKTIRQAFRDVREQGARWFVTPQGFARIGIAWLLIASVIALCVTPDLRAGLGIWKAYIVEPILLAVVAPRIITTRTALRPVLWALVGLTSVVGVLAVWQYITGQGIPEPWAMQPGRRAVGVFAYPNAVGLLLAPLTTLCVGVMLYGKSIFRSSQQFRAARIVLSGAVMLGAAGIIAARADGAAVAVIVATWVLLLCTRIRWVMLGVAVLAGVAATVFEPTRRILLFQDVSGEVRLALWNGTWNLIQHHPWVGAGLAGFPQLYDQYRLARHVELLEYAHNILFDFWTQLGLLGAVWIIAACIAVIGIALRARKATDGLSLILLGLAVSFIVYGLVDVPYFKNDLAILTWLMLAAAWVAWSYTCAERRKAKS